MSGGFGLEGFQAAAFLGLLFLCFLASVAWWLLVFAASVASWLPGFCGFLGGVVFVWFLWFFGLCGFVGFLALLRNGRVQPTATTNFDNDQNCKCNAKNIQTVPLPTNVGNERSFSCLNTATSMQDTAKTRQT